MQESLTYHLEHANATVDLSLTAGRLVVNTQGRGPVDKPRTIDLPLAELKNFCLVPTIKAQNIVGREAGESVYDRSYNAEFIFSYHEHGKLQKKRVFVNSGDENFRRLLTALAQQCPHASLLHLEPAEAQRQMGVISAAKAVFVIVGLIIAVPLIIALIFLVAAIVDG